MEWNGRCVSFESGPKMHFFENGSQGGEIPKTQPSRFHVDSVSTYFPKRWRYRPTPRPLASDLWTPQHLTTTTTMAADNMLVLVLQQILSLLGLLGQNIMLLCHYARQKRILDNRICHIILDPPQRVTRRATRTRFWVRPGWTSSWWDNFVNGLVVNDEWRDHFRMSRASLVALSEEVRPYIEGQTTVMRAPIETVKRVAMTLYYLSDEGRLWKIANVSGMSW